MSTLCDAVQEFKKVLELSYFAATSSHMTLHLGLACAAAAAAVGNTAEPRRRYQDFLALVSNADPDLPVITKARAEYARLK